MKNGVAYKNQDVYLQINIYLNKTSTLPFRPVLPLYRNQSTGLCNKSMVWLVSMDGFYTITALDWNRLILTTSFTYIIFFFHEATLFTQVSKKRSFHNFMFFWILIKLNFISILICWKKIFYLENFSTENQQLTF